MNSILERVVTPKEGSNLKTSVKHYNNFSPMFRGPLTSDTLLSISKNWLNKKLHSKNGKKFKTFLKGSQTARQSIRQRLKRPAKDEKIFGNGISLEEMPPIRTIKSPLNQKEIPIPSSQRPTFINLPVCESETSIGVTPKFSKYSKMSKMTKMTKLTNLNTHKKSDPSVTFRSEPNSSLFRSQTESKLLVKKEDTYEFLKAILKKPFSPPFKGNIFSLRNLIF